MINGIRSATDVRISSRRMRESIFLYGVGSQATTGAIEPIAPSASVDSDSAFFSVTGHAAEQREIAVVARPDGSRYLSVFA